MPLTFRGFCQMLASIPSQMSKHSAIIKLTQENCEIQWEAHVY